MASPDYYAGVRGAVPVPYVAGPPNRDPESLQAELVRLQNAVETLSNLVPQIATSPPEAPIDRMIRYARAPWQPLGPGDRWVQYNGTTWIAFP